MIIAVSGLTGSGKDTLGKNIALALGIRHLNPTFKDLAKKEKISLMELQKRAEKDKNIDKKFDSLLKHEAAKGSCVSTSWLSPWMLKADFRIYLSAPLDVRAKRIAKRDSMSLREAINHVKKRDNQNRKRYLKLYGIDIYNLDIFDICLNSAKFSPEQLKAIALVALKTKNNIK